MMGAAPTTVRAGAVYVIDFPTALGLRSMVRPAICLISADWENLDEIVVLCAITSSERREHDRASVTLLDWQIAGLTKRSVAQVDRLHSSQARFFRKHLGDLSERDFISVREAFGRYTSGLAMQQNRDT